jgi:hypothetical protein
MVVRASEVAFADKVLQDKRAESKLHGNYKFIMLPAITKQHFGLKIYQNEQPVVRTSPRSL